MVGRDCGVKGPVERERERERERESTILTLFGRLAQREAVVGAMGAVIGGEGVEGGWEVVGQDEVMVRSEGGNKQGNNRLP